MPSADELRDKLVSAIADVVGTERGRQQAWAESTGLDPAEVGRLARREPGEYSLQRLVNLSGLFGLNPQIHIVGARQLDPGAVKDTRYQRRAGTRPAAADYSDSGRLSRALAGALADCIDAALAGRTQAELAEETQLPRPTISQLKNQRIERFKLDSLIDYAPKFGLTVDIEVNRAHQST
ncbi:XRE family transcriptional regulator [Nocardia sp. NPDC127526]|uniref:XRE family transcriptional regulator n=1 Tax=Nocardia sp. NPDC127526 TaxID=3345393 RepID=UPI00362B8DEA